MPSPSLPLGWVLEEPGLRDHLPPLSTLKRKINVLRIPGACLPVDDVRYLSFSVLLIIRPTIIRAIRVPCVTATHVPCVTATGAPCVTAIRDYPCVPLTIRR